MIPPFDQDGRLPPGMHWCTWEELVNALGWSARRQWLITGLLRALQALRAAGCQTVYIDGSFATSKEEPGDYDGCWDLAGVDPNRLDPVLLKFENSRFAQKAKYRGEFFPANWIANSYTGDRYLEFFQRDKDGNAKGLVALKLADLP